MKRYNLYEIYFGKQIMSLSRLLLEAPEDEEEAPAEGGEEEDPLAGLEADVGGTGGGDNPLAGLDDAAEGGGAAKEEEEEEEPKQEKEIRPERVAVKTIDDAVRDFIMDVEQQSLENPSPVTLESVFFEADDRIPTKKNKSLNLNVFSSGVARLVTSYQNLLDIETLIIDQSIDYLKTYYDDETAKDFEEMLEKNFDLRSANSKPYSVNTEPDVPIAIGAHGGGEGPV